jgi:hypothetical protein
LLLSAANRGEQWGEVVNQATASAYVAPYVQVRHAIHLLYATSPYSRDGAAGRRSALNLRFDKNGIPLPLERHGCGCSLCAQEQGSRRIPHGLAAPKSWGK